MSDKSPEISTGIVINLELEKLVTARLDAAYEAKVRELKLPKLFVEQELGITFDPRIDPAKLQKELGGMRAELDRAVEQAARTGKKATVSLKDGNVVREFQAEAAQLLTLQNVVDEQIKFMNQKLRSFQGTGIDKLIAELRSGKRKATDLRPDEIDVVARFAAYMGELGQQTASFASNTRKLGRKSFQQLDPDTVLSLDRIPLILENFARIGQRLGGISKSLPRVLQEMVEAQQALERQSRQAEVLRAHAATFAVPAANQRALVKGLNDNDLEAGRRTIQERLKALSDAQSRGVNLTQQEAQEFERLRNAGQFVKREMRTRAGAADAYYNSDNDLAKYEAQQAEQTRRTREREDAAAARREAAERARRERDVRAAFARRDESLRFADVALQKGDSADPQKLRDDPRLRSELRADLQRELGSLRGLQRGLGDQGVDNAIQSRLQRLAAHIDALDGIVTAAQRAERDRLERTRALAALEKQDGAFKGKNLDRSRVVGDAIRADMAFDYDGARDLPKAEVDRYRRQLTKAFGSLDAFNTTLPQGSPERQAADEAFNTLARALDRLNDSLKAPEKEKPVRQLTPREQRRGALDQAINDAGGLDRLDQVAPELRPHLPSHLRDRERDLLAELGRANGGDPSARAPADISGDIQRTRAALDRLTPAANNARGAMGELGRVFNTFFKYALGYGALYQVIGAIGMLGRSVLDLEDKLAQIRATAGLTDGEIRNVAKSIEAVAGSYKFSVDEIADAALTLAQAGVGMDKMGSSLDAVAKFATATGSNLQQAADLITSLQDVYQDIGADKISGLLTQAVNISKLTGGDLTTIIGLSAGVAESFNLSAEQYLAAVSTLRNAGLKASTVATGLRQTMLEVFNPDDKLLSVLQQRYKSIGEDNSKADIKARFFQYSQGENSLTAALNELERLGLNGSGKSQFEGAFDIRSRNVLEALARNRPELASSEAQLGAGDPSAIAAAEAMQTVRGALLQVKNESTLLAEALTRDLLPGLREFLFGVADLLRGLRELDGDLKSGGGRGVGSVLGNTVIPAGIMGALATRGGYLSRIGAFAGYGAAAGVGALGGTAGADAAGASSRTSELIGSVAGIALPMLLGRFMGRRGAGNPSSPDFNGPPAPPGLGNAAGGLAGSLGSLLSMFTRLGPMVAATGPLGMFLAGLAALAAGAGLYKTLRGNSATEQFAAATDNLAAGAAGFQASTRLENEYSGKIKGARTELSALETKAESLNAQLTEYFGGSAEQAVSVTELLQQLYKEGLDASGGARQEIIGQLQEKATKPLSDALVNDLGRLSTEVNSQTVAIIDNAAREYERVIQLGEKASEGDKTKAKAFEETFNAAYRGIQEDPSRAGPAQRLQAIRAFYDRIQALEKEANDEKRVKLQEQLNTAQTLFAEAARDDTVDIGDRARTIVNLVKQLGGDVVAALDVQILELEKVLEELKAEYNRSGRESTKLQIEATESALAGGKRRRGIEFEGRTAQNAATGQDANRQILDLEKAIADAKTYGTKIPDGAEALLANLKAGGGVAVDDNKVARLTQSDAVKRALGQMVTENDRLKRGRENTAAIDKARRLQDQVTAEAKDAAKFQAIGSDTDNLSDTARALGLNPSSLQGGALDQAAQLRGAGDSGKTAVDELAVRLLARAEAELENEIMPKLRNLEREASGGDNDARQKAIELINGRAADVQRKIEEIQGKRGEKNAELVQKSLTQLADKLEADGKAMMADTKKRFDDAVTSGQLTATRLEAFQQEEVAALDKLRAAFQVKLQTQKRFFKNGKYTQDGLDELARFTDQNAPTYDGAAGAKAVVSSSRAKFDQSSANIEAGGGLERQRRQAATGRDFAGNEEARALQILAAKNEQLGNVAQALNTAQSELDELVSRGQGSSDQATRLSQFIAETTREQQALVREMDTLTAKAEELNGSITEEFDQILDNLSVDAFKDRAARGTEAISQGVGSALEDTINGIGDALVNARKKGVDFKNEMKSLAAEVGESLAKMFAREGVKQLFSFLVQGVGMVFGGGPQTTNAGTSGGMGQGTRNAATGWADISVEGYAAGGTIVGPGTGTSDSIRGMVVDAQGRPVRPVAVSNGESILTARATRMLGKRSIELMNKGIMPMAQQVMTTEGGVVNNAPTTMLALDMPISVAGGSEGSGGINPSNAKALQDSLRHVVVTEIERQKRPGGALYK